MRVVPLVLLSAIAASIAGCPKPKVDARSDASPRATVRDAATASPTALVRTADDGAVAAAAADAVAVLFSDAGMDGGKDGGKDGASPRPDGGMSACRLVDGPLQQPTTGPAALAIDGESLRVVTNESGVPRTTIIPVSAVPSKVTAHAVSLPAPGPRVSSPPCAVAWPFMYCMDSEGAVHRSKGVSESDGPSSRKLVAHAQKGTRLAAVRAGEGSVLLYLAHRKTTEGFVSSAWLVEDEKPPVHFSEEGSGATSIDLVSVASKATGTEEFLALLVDARASMTPVHARGFSLRAGKFVFGTDAVIFVGGSGERETRGVLGTTLSSTSTFAFVPISRDIKEFGVATVKISDPPSDDSPTTWSLYPGGLDPAPIAATRSEPKIHVLRVRPEGPGLEARRTLELGTIAQDGAFELLAAIETADRPRDVAIAADRRGSLWLYYSDTRGSFVERRVCP